MTSFFEAPCASHDSWPSQSAQTPSQTCRGAAGASPSSLIPAYFSPPSQNISSHGKWANLMIGRVSDAAARSTPESNQLEVPDGTKASSTSMPPKPQAARMPLQLYLIFGVPRTCQTQHAMQTLFSSLGDLPVRHRLFPLLRTSSPPPPPIRPNTTHTGCTPSPPPGH